MRIRRKLLLWLMPLYLVTWVGGWVSHSASLKNEAQRWYETNQSMDAELAATAVKEGREPPLSSVSEAGPRAHVSWCLPILPGVLLASSHSVIGPVIGWGGVKVVVFYGFGSWATGPLWRWRS